VPGAVLIYGTTARLARTYFRERRFTGFIEFLDECHPGIGELLADDPQVIHLSRSCEQRNSRGSEIRGEGGYYHTKSDVAFSLLGRLRVLGPEASPRIDKECPPQTVRMYFSPDGPRA
jgi:hypothetical protein